MNDPVTPLLQASPYALVLYLLGRLALQVLQEYVAMLIERDNVLGRLRAIESKLLIDATEPPEHKFYNPPEDA